MESRNNTSFNSPVVPMRQGRNSEAAQAAINAHRSLSAPNAARVPVQGHHRSHQYAMQHHHALYQNLVQNNDAPTEDEEDDGNEDSGRNNNNPAEINALQQQQQQSYHLHQQQQQASSQHNLGNGRNLTNHHQIQNHRPSLHQHHNIARQDQQQQQNAALRMHAAAMANTNGSNLPNPPPPHQHRPLYHQAAPQQSPNINPSLPPQPLHPQPQPVSSQPIQPPPLLSPNNNSRNPLWSSSSSAPTPKHVVQPHSAIPVIPKPRFMAPPPSNEVKLARPRSPQSSLNDNATARQQQQPSTEASISTGRKSNTAAADLKGRYRRELRLVIPSANGSGVPPHAHPPPLPSISRNSVLNSALPSNGAVLSPLSGRFPPLSVFSARTGTTPRVGDLGMGSNADAPVDPLATPKGAANGSFGVLPSPLGGTTALLPLISARQMPAAGSLVVSMPLTTPTATSALGKRESLPTEPPDHSNNHGHGMHHAIQPAAKRTRIGSETF